MNRPRLITRTFSLVILLQLVGFLSINAAADSIDPAKAVLPAPSGKMAIGFDGSYVYIFGGTGCCDDQSATDAILRYDPLTDRITSMYGRLPTPRFGAQAIWTGQFFFVLGGRSAAGVASGMDEIVRYDPRNDSVRVMPTRLLMGEWDGSAAWDGHAVYIFPGRNSSYSSPTKVMRYDPERDLITNLSRSPVIEGANAVFDGGQIWLHQVAELIRYSPSNGTSQLVRSDLPYNTMEGGYVSGVWDGRDLYFFGGMDNSCGCSKIIRYNPATNTSAVMAARLPSGLTGNGVVWTGRMILIFGGGTGYHVLNPSDVIYRYNESPGPAGNFAVRPGPHVGEMDLRWNPPGAATYAQLGGYRLYRTASNSVGSYHLVAAISSGNTSYSDMGLPNATTFRYRIAAFNARGESPNLTGFATTYGPPAPPSSFQSTPGPNKGEVSLSWAAPADDGGMPLSGYHLLGVESGRVVLDVALSPENSTWFDEGLAPGEVREYQLTAFNPVGWSAPSAASGTAPVPPGAPEAVSVETTSGRGELDVAWEPPGSNGGASVSTYRVYRSTIGEAETKVAETTSRSIIDAGLADSKTFFYRITAANVAGEGTPSARVFGNTPTPARAIFNYSPENGGVGARVQFSDESLSDGKVVAWKWDFGDGSMSTLKGPSTSFLNAGDYTVTLTITDSFGFTDSTSKVVSVGGNSAVNGPPPSFTCAAILAFALLRSRRAR